MPQACGKSALNASVAGGLLWTPVKLFAQQSGGKVQSDRILAHAGRSREEVGMRDPPILDCPTDVGANHSLSHNARKQRTYCR